MHLSTTGAGLFRIPGYIALFSLIIFAFAGVSFGQACDPPAIQFNSRSENIFTAEQEMYLGETILDKVRNNHGVIDDAAVTAYLNKIGERLGRHLPNSGIKFRFMISDVPDTNAFAFPGGIIMVTRKMVNFVKNEDELAGVMAHELGHATVRHGGLDWSKYFTSLLNVKAVGDRADVFEKYNQVIDLWNTKNVKTGSNHEDNQQLEADKLGMFALVAAGYDASQFPQFWVRLTKAKKRGGLSALFGSSSPADKRLKEMLDQFQSLPPACREQRGGAATADFEAWRTSVLTFNASAKTEVVPGLINVQEFNPLRSEIEHLKFSGNGRYILAQDASTITVLTREPLKAVFQVPALDARPAWFSADSSEIVVVSESLHVQKWNIAANKLTSEYEVSIPDPFWQSEVSPNGDQIAVYHYSGDVAIYELKTGDELFRDKKFFVPQDFIMGMMYFMRAINGGGELPVLSLNFSPDAKYLLVSRDLSPGYEDGFVEFSGSPFGSTMRGASILGLQSDKFLGVDIAARKAFPVGDNIKKLVRIGFGFMGTDRIVGRADADIKKSGIFSFPDGKRLEQFDLGGTSFSQSTAGDHIVVRPVNGAAVGVFDLKQKKYVFAGKKKALDVSGNSVVAERKNGELAIYTVGTVEPIAAVTLPKSDFGSLRTVTFSDDGQWLAASERSRGAVWNLETGERRFHIRSFRGSYIAPDGKVYADFPKLGETPRSIAALDTTTLNVVQGTELKDGDFRQFGRYVVVRRPLKKEAPKTDKIAEKKAGDKPFVEEEADRRIGSKQTAMEVLDAQTGASLWTREFRDETPRYFVNPTHNSMVLVWPVKSAAAAEIIKQNGELQGKVKTAKENERDLLIQIVDPATGVTRSHFILETGQGSFGVQSATAAGDYLVVDDDENRQLIYSISKGSLIRRVFGSKGTFSPQNGLIAVENTEGRVSVIDIATGRESGQVVLKKGIAAMTFSSDGKRLFLLTRDQIAYVLDAEKIGNSQAN
ncbi:MAG: M48 family metalloprotease [Acidobacteria bacterium]|nr:M48 family metalloprotease [Acidobacteriota bacterium]